MHRQQQINHRLQETREHASLIRQRREQRLMLAGDHGELLQVLVLLEEHTIEVGLVLRVLLQEGGHQVQQVGEAGVRLHTVAPPGETSVAQRVASGDDDALPHDDHEVRCQF